MSEHVRHFSAQINQNAFPINSGILKARSSKQQIHIRLTKQKRSVRHIKLKLSEIPLHVRNNSLGDNRLDGAEVKLEEEKSEKESLITKITSFFRTTGLPPPTNRHFYEIGRKIGKGAFGKVYVASHKLTGQEVAIKTIDKTCFSIEEIHKKVLQEVHLMRKIQHINVIRLLEVFETCRFFMIVLEYAENGDLKTLVKSKISLPEEESKSIFVQIARGLYACHMQKVIHRDVKLDNILLGKDWKVKICDFGVSTLLQNKQVVFEQCGTPAYLAPEVLINKGYTLSADVWSLGVVLFTMLSGQLPFKAHNLNDLHKRILTGDYAIPEFVRNHAADLIRRMLCPIPQNRITLEDVFKHPWLHEFNVLTCKRVDLRHKRNLILDSMAQFGYPKNYVVQSLKIKDINHSTATYNLLDLLYSDCKYN